MDETSLQEQWDAMDEKQRFNALVLVHRELTALAKTRSKDLADHVTATESVKKDHATAVEKLKQDHANAIIAAPAKQYRDVIVPIKQAEHRRQLAALQAQQEAELKSV